MYSGVTCGNEQCLCCHSGYWDQALTEKRGKVQYRSGGPVLYCFGWLFNLLADASLISGVCKC
jgi:hypothetical protein